MTYNEYKVEFRVFRDDGNEYQMRKIPLQEGSEDEAREILIERGYIEEDDKINILNIAPSDDYSFNNEFDDNYSPNSFWVSIFDFLESKTGKFLMYGFVAILVFTVFNMFIGGSGNVSSVDDARSYLDGKTFIATPRGDVWYKLSFKGNTCRLENGMPQYVGWSNKYNGGYTVMEGRYTDTGKSYYYVKFGASEGLDCLMFDIKNKALYTCLGGDNPLATMKIGDRDPWN